MNKTMLKRSSPIISVEKYTPIPPLAAFPIHIYPEKFHNVRAPRALHFHDELEIALVTSGDGLFMVNESIFKFKKGDVFIIQPSVSHYAYSPNCESFSMHFISFIPSKFLSGLAEPLPYNLPFLFTESDFPEMTDKVGEIIKESSSLKPAYRTKIRSIILDIFVYLNRLSKEKIKASVSNVSDGLPAELGKVRSALDLISTRFKESISVDDLAFSCRLSPEQLRRYFRKIFSLSPIDYMNNYRLREACKLLAETKIPISEVASKSGFASLPWFNRSFQKVFSMSPREWRKRDNASRL